ncbi:MAG: hydantoinase/oxoprolinase family protein, partial [Bacilli bacterium]
YSRGVTVSINASLRPVVRRAVQSLQHHLRLHGLNTEPLIMQSNGGLCPAGDIERQAASTVMSGPVGGVIASAFLGEKVNKRNIVATDMGGTSFDVGLILDGRPIMSNVTRVDRNDIALPSVAVRTIGAGSGSIAAVANGYLTVGPQSAGAEPGPVCYGRGGVLPTVADADVVLGYINPDNFLDGRLRLDRQRAYQAIEEKIAVPLGMGVEQAAEGIKAIVDNRMADLIRQMTVQQGFDPSDFALFAYGGAGPTHAFSYGKELGISEIIVPLSASVHSAFGVLASDFTTVEEVSEPLQSPPGRTDYAVTLSAAKINAVFETLTKRALHRLTRMGLSQDQCRVMRFIEMRFRFQIHELTIPIDGEQVTGSGVEALVERFIDSYEARFGKGSAFKAAGVEITTFRVVAQGTAAKLEVIKESAHASYPLQPSGERPVFSEGSWRAARIYDGRTLHPGATMRGLSIIEMPDTTIIIGLNQTATVDVYRNVAISIDS